jgi:TetR/AcrR family transcriptional repressor of nem operon
MRYDRSHKQETKARVLKAAAKALCENGPQGMGVAQVMCSAGLTHGGFYAHFPSKEAFLAESLKEAFVQAAERLEKTTVGLLPREALTAYIDFYVSAVHRDSSSGGCAIVALNSELPRQSKKFRAVFDTGVKRIIARLTDWIAAMGLSHADQLAVLIFSAMVGAVALSRAVSDPKLSDELLDAARAGIKTRLGLSENDSRKTLKNHSDQGVP